jgi:hypothetical protein
MARERYDLTIRAYGRDVQKFTANLDLDQDEEETLSGFIADAMEERREKPEAFGQYSVEIRKHGKWEPLMEFKPRPGSAPRR